MKEYKSHTVNGKNIQDHRSVMEELLGEKLPPDTVVHHINGNKTDNRPENEYSGAAEPPVRSNLSHLSRA